MDIVEFLLGKIGSPDYQTNSNEWEEILKDSENVDRDRLEKALKETPGYTFLEVINFAVYFKDLSKEEEDGNSVEDHFISWQNKIK